MPGCPLVYDMDRYAEDRRRITPSRDFIGKFVGCPLPESPVRAALIIFFAPSFYDLPRIGPCRKPVGIQAFRPEGPVERFHQSVIRRLARTRECDPHSVLIGPQIHRSTRKLAAVVPSLLYSTPSSRV